MMPGLRITRYLASITLCSLLLITFPSAPANPANANGEGGVLAFPGAEGYGRFSRGGRGGRVFRVTHLGNDGPGSLRAAIEAAGPRTVVFEVSGNIELESPLTIVEDLITIAGQSAPGSGITLKNHGLFVRADDVVIRYIRARPGSGAGVETDAISVNAGENIIIDHCSTSWATDETLTVSPSDKAGMRSIDRVTVQWNIISESLNQSVHSKGSHGYGSLVRGSAGSRFSFHHNLWAHHQARMPRPGNYVDAETDPEGAFFDFRNNVFYNWGGTASGYNADRDSISRYNFINNYYLEGPDSTGSLAFEESNSLAQSHFSGNLMNRELPANPWTLIHFQDGRTSGHEIPFPAAPVRTEEAAQAFVSTLELAGASLHRDEVDRRVVSQVRSGLGRIIDRTEEIGGWPELPTSEPPVDSDGDGMPDSWEHEHKLDPLDSSDGPGDHNGDGYTNLEDYLNGLLVKS